MATRTTTLTIKVTQAEAATLAVRAADAGMALRPYLRRELLAAEPLPRHTSLVLVAAGKLAEFTRRIWEAAAADNLSVERVAEIGRQVDGIDARVYLARATGGAQ